MRHTTEPPAWMYLPRRAVPIPTPAAPPAASATPYSSIPAPACPRTSGIPVAPPCCGPVPIASSAPKPPAANACSCGRCGKTPTPPAVRYLPNAYQAPPTCPTSSQQPPQPPSDPYTNYYFTCEPTPTLISTMVAHLDSPWPHNYQALEALSFLPLSLITDHLGPLMDKLKKFASTPLPECGADFVRQKAAQLLAKVTDAKAKADAKAQAEKAKKEEEEGRQTEDAIMSMWGRMHADNSVRATAAMERAYAACPGACHAAGLTCACYPGWAQAYRGGYLYGSYPW